MTSGVPPPCTTAVHEESRLCSGTDAKRRTWAGSTVPSGMRPSASSQTISTSTPPAAPNTPASAASGTPDARCTRRLRGFRFSQGGSTAGPP
ncbi:hypothetical protein SBADM41S_02288 [Streptomyces badius]